MRFQFAVCFATVITSCLTAPTSSPASEGLHPRSSLEGLPHGRGKQGDQCGGLDDEICEAPLICDNRIGGVFRCMEPIGHLNVLPERVRPDSNSEEEWLDLDSSDLDAEDIPVNGNWSSEIEEDTFIRQPRPFPHHRPKLFDGKKSKDVA